MYRLFQVADGEEFLVAGPVDHPFPLYRINTDEAAYRCLAVFQQMLEIRHRVNVFPRFGTSQLQVQVRSGRSPFITAQGNDVSLFHRELSGLEFQVAHKRFMRILILTYASLYVFCK